jgi:citrate lyase subunit beta/citryl-CoA lyase
MTPHTPTATRIRSELARTWLLVNGAQPSTFQRAFISPADQVVLDIEDAVDIAAKPEARETVVKYLKNGHRAWVRINDRSTPYWADDIAALRDLPGLQGVMLAKTETGQQVAETHDRLGRKRVLALVESAAGIERAVEIASSPGVFRLAFGSGDYRGDTGTAADDLAMAYPRTRLVIASRVANLPGPIDGPSTASTHSLVRQQSEVSVTLGMTGKLCLTLDQLQLVNEVMSPAPSDVAWAQSFLSEFDERGRVVRDGSDPPRLRRAERILERAQSFAL